MALRLNNTAPDYVKLRRQAAADKLMNRTPAELMDLFNNGDPEAGTTGAQESRRALVFCVIALRGLFRK